MPEQTHIPEQTLAAIEKVKSTHANMVVTFGVGIGVILGIYFFTFPQFLDRAPGVVTFQAISAVFLFASFFFLKRIAFLMTRLRLVGKPDCKSILQAISVADVDKDPAFIFTKLG